MEKMVVRKINFMKQIDRYIGIPLCFFLTFIDNFLKLFIQKNSCKKRDVPRKILFIKPSEIGAIILSYPLMRKVQEKYPEAKIYFLSFKNNKCLFEVFNIVPLDNILTVRDDSVVGFIRDAVKVIFKLRKERIDVVFDLEFFSRFTAIVTYLSFAPKRIGFFRYTLEGLYRGDLLTHKFQYNPSMHISRLFSTLAQGLDDTKKDTPSLEKETNDEKVSLPQFVPTIEQKQKILKKLKGLGIQETSRLFLINPGEGWIPLREWPLNNFIALAHKLLKQSNSYIILVGTSGCLSKAEEFKKEFHNKSFIDLSGKTSIPELLTLFTMADALISNDSGLSHLASLSAIRQFVFFGPESPKVFSPLTDKIRVFYSELPCSPCLSAFNHRTSKCRHNLCLELICPQDVYDTISKELQL